MNKHLQKIAIITLAFTIFLPVTQIRSQQQSKSYGIINTIAQFNKLIASTVPTVIKFSAPWCGPCRHMEPAYDSVAKQYGPEVKFYEVNTSSAELQPLVKKYNIQGLPTIAYFHQNREIMRDRKGALTKQELNSSVQQFLGKVKVVKPQIKKADVRTKREVKPKTQQTSSKTKVVTAKKQAPKLKQTKTVKVKAQPKKRIVKRAQETICY